MIIKYASTQRRSVCAFARGGTITKTKGWPCALVLLAITRKEILDKLVLANCVTGCQYTLPSNPTSLSILQGEPQALQDKETCAMC